MPQKQDACHAGISTRLAVGHLPCDAGTIDKRFRFGADPGAARALQVSLNLAVEFPERAVRAVEAVAASARPLADYGDPRDKVP